MKNFLIAAITALGMSSTTFAADEIVIDQSRFSWAGSYMGAQFGYLGVEDDFLDPDFPAPNPTIGTASDDSIALGLFLGRNWQKEDVVFGLEADFMLTNGDAIGQADPAFGVFGRAELDWQASLRARLGIVKNDALFFVTGGLAVADVEYDYAFPGPFFGFGDQFSETATGYTLGGGVEWFINESVTAKFEYRYSDYGSAEHTISNCCAPPPASQKHELTTNAVNFGISKKLN